ncbi:hypothetical protein MTP39_09415 [Faecalibacterium sp. I3-3-33]|uniref:hypothetical protein n=1 Tax=Faecalibacterium sp. I3-3-33 TaxID=2929492 RepID=UPI002014F87D|nr:hypothetical protein [Faecalibacterium sp. I3-3-33]UQK44799.1 hypothetical protein MTP39_09415 [Faecalibacterium sp. I3-3-33]
MNLDETFGLNASMPLVATGPLLLLVCVAEAVLAGWLCVHRTRNTNDVERSVRMYLPLAAVGTAVFTLAGIPLLFAAGAQLCGLAALGLISNYYFYH